MSEAAYHVRRATVDDLSRLIPLWTSMKFSAEELEPHLTDFQVVESADEELLGLLALEISGRQGRLHTEAFSDFGIADKLRGLLWNRIQSLAKSLGLARIWTAETAPFWKQQGFEPPDAAMLKELPQSWTELDCDWLLLKLRDEGAIKQALEKEFNRLKDEEQRRTSGSINTVSTIRYVAIFIAIVVSILGVILCVYLLRHYPLLLHRHY